MAEGARDLIDRVENEMHALQEARRQVERHEHELARLLLELQLLLDGTS